jgi:hypothetical protein
MCTRVALTCINLKKKTWAGDPDQSLAARWQPLMFWQNSEDADRVVINADPVGPTSHADVAALTSDLYRLRRYGPGSAVACAEAEEARSRRAECDAQSRPG